MWRAPEHMQRVQSIVDQSTLSGSKDWRVFSLVVLSNWDQLDLPQVYLNFSQISYPRENLYSSFESHDAKLFKKHFKFITGYIHSCCRINWHVAIASNYFFSNIVTEQEISILQSRIKLNFPVEHRWCCWWQGRDVEQVEQKRIIFFHTFFLF